MILQDDKPRKRSSNSCQLLPNCINVVVVNVRVPKSVDQLPGLQSTCARQQHREQCIRCEVKRHPQPHVARALVHQARELPLRRDVELCKHVTRWQGHIIQCHWIPSGHQNTAIIRMVLEQFHNGPQLIDSLPIVLRPLSPSVLCTKVPPLKTVDRPQVAFRSLEQPAAVKKLP